MPQVSNGTQRTMPSSVAPQVTTESRPVPDPTVLTTQQIFNAVASLRDVMDVRLSAMDKAVHLLQEAANRKPTIGELEASFAEKFNRVDTIFAERSQQASALTAANLTAVQAALQAQKDAASEVQKASSAAVAKAETATNEALKQLQTLFQTSIGGLGSQVQDLKSRLDRGEGGTVGQREERSDNRHLSLDNRSLIFSVMAALAAGTAMVIGILNFAKIH